MRIRIARGFFASTLGLALLGTALVLLLTATGIFTYYYIQFGRQIDQRLTGQIYQNTSRVYSAPGHIFVGESLRASDLTTYLLGAGYQEGAAAGSTGEFHVAKSTVEIRPSADSYFREGNALLVSFSGSEIAHISQISNGAELDSAEIEPRLITNLFDSGREKRRILAL